MATNKQAAAYAKQIADLEAGNSVLRETIRALIDVGSRKIAHAHNGMCPDAVEGFRTRDDECPACRALVAAQELLDGK